MLPHASAAAVRARAVDPSVSGHRSIPRGERAVSGAGGEWESGDARGNSLEARMGQWRRPAGLAEVTGGHVAEMFTGKSLNILI
jgi:hypothetical protein